MLTKPSKGGLKAQGLKALKPPERKYRARYQIQITHYQISCLTKKSCKCSLKEATLGALTPFSDSWFQREIADTVKKLRRKLVLENLGRIDEG